MGFNWTIDIASGTQVLLIGSDDRGIGSGGKALFTIEDTPNNNCLNSNSPSSTPGTPPGSYPTSTSGSTTNGSTGSVTHTGAIVGACFRPHLRRATTYFLLSGGVIGAAVLILIGLVAFWLIRRRALFALSKERPVNVIQDDEDGNGENNWHHPPPYYAPDPFPPPTPTIKEMSEAMFTQDHPPSVSTVTIDVRSPQAPMMTTTHKNSSVPQLRPINIIQHDDSGAREDLSDQGEPETIELPPAYSNVSRTRHGEP